MYTFEVDDAWNTKTFWNKHHGKRCKKTPPCFRQGPPFRRRAWSARRVLLQAKLVARSVFHARQECFGWDVFWKSVGTSCLVQFFTVDLFCCGEFQQKRYFLWVWMITSLSFCPGFISFVGLHLRPIKDVHWKINHFARWVSINPTKVHPFASSVQPHEPPKPRAQHPWWIAFVHKEAWELPQIVWKPAPQKISSLSWKPAMLMECCISRGFCCQPLGLQLFKNRGWPNPWTKPVYSVRQ